MAVCVVDRCLFQWSFSPSLLKWCWMISTTLYIIITTCRIIHISTFKPLKTFHFTPPALLGPSHGHSLDVTLEVLVMAQTGLCWTGATFVVLHLPSLGVTRCSLNSCLKVPASAVGPSHNCIIYVHNCCSVYQFLQVTQHDLAELYTAVVLF